MCELEPCPFCGGEAAFGANSCQGFEYVRCVSCKARTWSCYNTKEQAAEAWNTRAERTCRYEHPDPHDHPGVWNTECGNHVYWNVDNDDCGIPPDFCPKCGAKVVEL